MQELWIALGLVLVIEGALYALFPEGMLSMLRQLPEIGAARLRAFGLFAMAAGWLLVWWVKS